MGIKLQHALLLHRARHSIVFRVATLFALPISITSCASNKPLTTSTSVDHHSDQSIQANVVSSRSESRDNASSERYVNDGIRYMPVMGISQRQISNNFGDPRDGGARTHKGIDIMAPAGRPLIAVTSGRVEQTYNNLGGNAIWLLGDDGISYYYAHLSRFDDNVRDGFRVSGGQTIGYVGNTGNAKNTPPHLHFEMRRNGETINPYHTLRSQDLVVIPLERSGEQDQQYAARTAPKRSTPGDIRKTTNVTRDTKKLAARNASKKIAAKKTSSGRSKVSSRAKGNSGSNVSSRKKSSLAVKKSMVSKKKLAGRKAKGRKYASR